MSASRKAAKNTCSKLRTLSKLETLTFKIISSEGKKVSVICKDLLGSFKVRKEKKLVEPTLRPYLETSGQLKSFDFIVGRQISYSVGEGFRGQNVSVLQLHSPEFRSPPITTFTDTGGSLRTAPRIHSSRFEKSSFLSDKNFKHHSFENSMSNALDKCHKEESGSNNKSFSVVITTGVNSSSLLSSPGRELSPVRWCDREVDGVYLGKSGWVQVQQRSLDENRKLPNYKVNPVPSLPSNVKLESNDSELDERKESGRPICLSLSVEEQKNREVTVESLRFKQEFGAVSVSPPPITPIISPPPAFKDFGLDNDSSRHSTKKILVGKPPLLPRSKAIVDCESPPKLPFTESNFKNSLPYQSKKLTPPLVANSQQQNHFSHLPHTKSLDNDASKKIYLNENNRSRLPVSLFDFRSLDRTICKHSDEFKTNETDSSIDGHDYKERDSLHRVTRKSSPYERLTTEAISADGFRSNHSSRNASRASCSNSATTRKYSKRSSSLESSGSSSSSDQNSSKLSSRELNLKESWQESEGPFNWDYRTLRVRRSKSLQLSEKSSPNFQSVGLTSAGKSWDQVPNEKISHSKSGENQQHFPAPSQDHSSTMTTLSEGTTSIIPQERSRKHLQRMIRLENERQQELFREAKKEARIISEFLNGTRSRAAARNLLMHRYLNQPEDKEVDEEEDKRKTLKQIPPEPEYDVHFIGTNQSYQIERQCGNKAPYGNKISTKGCSSKPWESNVWSHCTRRLNSSSPAFFQNRFATSDETTSILSSHGRSNQNGKEKRTELVSTSSESTKNHYTRKKKKRSKVLCQLPSDSREQISSSAYSDESQSLILNQVQKLKRHHKYDFEKSTNNLDILEVRSPFKEAMASFSLGVAKNQEKYQKPDFNLCDESPTTSSSSNDIWLNGSGSKSQIIHINSKASSPIEEYLLKSPIAHEDFTKLRRRESVHTNEDALFVNSQQKSLSLPKSFMSERNDRRHERQSNYFLCEEQYIEKPALDDCTNEFPSESSRTAPATPVHDLKNSKTNVTVKEKCRKSSSAPILDEPCSPEWLSQGYTFESGNSSKNKSSENNNFGKVPEKIKIAPSNKSVTSSESTLRKIRKKFSLKFSRAKENLRDNNNLWIESSIRNDNLANSQEMNLRKKFESNSADTQIENKVISNPKLRLPSTVGPPNKDHNGSNKVIKNKKCSSRDSGIQVDNLGNMAEGSYESLDAVNFDEAESLKKTRQNDRKVSEKSFRTYTASNQNYMNKFQMNNLNWRGQNEDYFRGVRRTNSDLGGQRVFLSKRTRDHCCRSNTSTSSSSFTNGTTRKDGLTQKDCEWFSERILLKRSFSQPLGVNDFSPLMRQRSLTTKSHNFSEDDRDQNEVTSEDEAISGSEMSFASLKERKKSFELPINKTVLILAEALWDHVAMEPDELPFRAGDVIKVLNMCDRDWWWGIAGESSGYFPSAFVRLRVSQEETVEDCSDVNEKETCHHVTTRRCRRSTSFLSTNQIRSKVVWELLNTERSFVKILHDIAEGFIVECRRRRDMFTPAQIDTIFSNLENLLAFQRKFLMDLEARVDLEFPHKSCVGEIFLNHKSGFQVYSEYCNAHPMAIATLQELYQVDSYNKFFEACRLMRGFNEIPLDGYLLTPVQRICKYPLQLAELLKYTKPEHPDHAKVGEALEAMREVANLINERKRKMESLEKLEAWQLRVEGWEGEDLIEISSQLIHQGEAVRITSGMWTSNITLFLFDHQIIYCKKDLLKKNTFIYKGRLCLDTSEVIDIPDGRDQQMGVSIRNGLKIYSCLKDKWLLFCCRSTEEKAKWLESFAQERRIVAQDVQDGLAIPLAARQLARMSAKSKRRPPSSSRNKDNFKMEPHFEGVNLITSFLNPNGVKMSRKVGTWFTFGGKKSSRVNVKSKNSLNFTE